MALFLLAGLALVFILPALAVAGKAYRGVYGALALGGVLAVLVGLGMQGRVDSHMTYEGQLGQQAFNTIGDPLAFLGIGACVGGMLGAMLWRPSPPRSGSTPGTSGPAV
jgi:hypothetical protein